MYPTTALVVELLSVGHMLPEYIRTSQTNLLLVCCPHTIDSLHDGQLMTYYCTIGAQEKGLDMLYK